MTSVSALYDPALYGARTGTTPMRAPAATDAARAAFVLAEQVYDPVLDPAVNPAVHQRYEAVDDMTVTAKAEDEGYSFWDFLDLINPLQHIPGVNTLYRELTGDTIKTPVQLIGATVLGGPIGFAAAMVDSVIEDSTGKDLGEHAMAMFKGPPSGNLQNFDAPDVDTPVAPPTKTMLADAREFIPEDYRTAQVAHAAPAALTPAAAAAAQPVPPQQLAMAASALKADPTEAEAFVKTAQIAAQANVFPTFKPSGRAAPGGLIEKKPDTAAAQMAAASTTASVAAAQMRFMPIQRTGAERAMTAAVRRDSDTTSTNELRARSKFAPGPVAMGRAAMAPATLAAATASQNKVAQAPAASAQEAYAYGREAAANQTTPEMPAWFDDAMLGAIDKYKAMQEAR